jgi:hypothetical protein
MNKKILIVGESFVAGSSVYDKTKTYAKHVAEDFDNVEIKAVPGAGNSSIAHTVLSNFQKFDILIINWTDTSRYDIQVYDKDTIKFYKHTDNQIAMIDQTFWLMSCGYRGYRNNKDSLKLWEPIYKKYFQVEDCWRRTFEQLLLVQTILKTHNKKVINYFSFDTFTPNSFIEFEKKYQATKYYNQKRWNKFKNNNAWLSLIDWSQIWFWKNKYTDTGGIMDWCHDNTRDISHHPTDDGHEQFYNSVAKPWLLKYTKQRK